MSNPYKISESKASVMVSDILSGDVSSIRVEYLTTGASGIKRSIFRQIPVPDASLFARVQTELHKGDKIEITAVNEWYEDGYATRLTGFRKTADLNPKRPIANGAINIVQGDTRQITLPSARDPKTKIKH